MKQLASFDRLRVNFLLAAERLGEADEAFRAAKGIGRGRCLEWSPMTGIPGSANFDPGSGPCDELGPEDEMCERCLTKKQNRANYTAKRLAAKLARATFRRAWKRYIAGTNGGCA